MAAKMTSTTVSAPSSEFVGSDLQLAHYLAMKRRRARTSMAARSAWLRPA